MSDPLDPELDQLFQLPPARMVEARTALAERLRKAGDRPASARIKAIKRPTPAAWALNQVHFGQPSLLARALEHAVQVRALHARDGVDARELRAAVDAQRGTLNELVELALKYCEVAGLPHGSTQQRKILATVQGWLSGAGDEPPGRMIHDIEAAGFGAVATVGAAPPRQPVPRPALPALPGPTPTNAAATKAAPAQSVPAKATSPQSAPTKAAPARLALGKSAPAVSARTKVVPPPAKPDARALARARAELEQRKQSAQRARELVRQRGAAQREAERELSRARASVQEAEQTLAERRTRLSQREADLARLQAALDEAQQEERRAEAALVGTGGERAS